MGLCFTSLLSTSDPNSTSLKSPHFSGGASPKSDGGTQSQKLFPHGHILERSKLKVFSFGDLKLATKSFKSDRFLGEGGFSEVYKGWLDENTLKPAKSGTGMAVAVKKLYHESTQGFEAWQVIRTEVYFLGRLSHPNLVKLLGYCWDSDELLLVYELLPNGSLDNHLFRRNPDIEPLSWNIRIKIAIGAARGLAFLHTSEKQVIYRNFKSSHIRLDANYNAKISDFFFARLAPSAGESHVSTVPVGTYGYLAPEYIQTGHLYVKSDTYSFGVVLLETLTGMRVIDLQRPTEQENLVEWVKPLLYNEKKLKTIKPLLYNEKKLKTIMDARIEGQYSLKAALQAVQLSLKCLEDDPENRPSMKDVVEALEGIEAIQGK